MDCARDFTVYKPISTSLLSVHSDEVSRIKRHFNQHKEINSWLKWKFQTDPKKLEYG